MISKSQKYDLKIQTLDFFVLRCVAIGVCCQSHEIWLCVTLNVYDIKWDANFDKEFPGYNVAF